MTFANMNDDGRQHREWIEAARAATGAREVVLNKLPSWARRAIRAALRREGAPARIDGFDACVEALHSIHRWRVRLFDHWGESKRHGEPTLVAEPYADREHIEAALTFADWIGCEVKIGGASWWYPGSTTRIEFYPRAEDAR